MMDNATEPTRRDRYAAQLDRIHRMIDECNSIGETGGMDLIPLSRARDALQAVADAWEAHLSRWWL